MKFSRLVPVVLVLALVAVLLTVLTSYQVIALDPKVAQVARWLFLVAFAAYGVQRRSLTFWIVVSMFVGAEIGNDYPEFAVNLKVLSDIFLKLVKTIIAPLVFATLVVGIAGHADLKQVGKMGLKALVYFEVITTFALFIGLAAINFTKAGVGISQAGVEVETEKLQAVKQSATDIILHIFPENIAKSVAEGQVLQVVVFAIIFAIGLAMVHQSKRRPMLELIESLSDLIGSGLVKGTHRSRSESESS